MIYILIYMLSIKLSNMLTESGNSKADSQSNGPSAQWAFVFGITSHQTMGFQFNGQSPGSAGDQANACS